MLKPSVEHLSALKTAMIQGASWRAGAASAGPKRVAAAYTWDQVVDRLVRALGV